MANIAGTGRSLVSSLGLGSALAQQQQQTQQLVDTKFMQGKLAAEKEITKAQRKRGTFETIGSAIGAVGGGLGGFMVGGPVGALKGAALGSKAGSTIGGAASGKRDVRGHGQSSGSQVIQTSLGIADSLVSAQKSMKLNKAAQNKEDFKTGVSSLNAINDTGIYTPESVMSSVESNDLSLLKESNDFKNTFDSDQQKFLFNRRDSILKDTSYKTLKDQIATSKELKDLLDTDTPLADVGAQFKTARLFQGGGVLTDQDFAAATGSPALGTKLFQAFKKIGKGRAAEVNREDMRKIADVLEQKASNRLNQFIDREVNAVESVSGIGRDRLDPIFIPLKVGSNLDTERKASNRSSRRYGR